jgi:Ca-activated chloride channel family protein
MRAVKRGLWILVALACAKHDAASGPTTRPSSGGPPPKDAVTVVVAYGSEKQTWMTEEVAAFLATNPKTASGHAITVDARPMGSGEAEAAIESGELKATVFSPASSVYLSLLQQKWVGTDKKAPPGDALVISPVVIAMWRPMAEALGWPKKPLGWSDLIAVAANPKQWAAFGHPEWGAFRLGHTHPEFSNSGILSILAEAYAGAKKTRGLTSADVANKSTKDFVSHVEETIVHYGKSTGFFSDKMLERGPSYLSAAVLYENLVIESYSKKSPMPMVAIYPSEGTFWSDHPYSILQTSWVTPDQKDGAQQLLAFLKAKPAQQRALALGFRPADPSIPMGAPIDDAHGVDPQQPKTLLDVPDADVLANVLEVWKDVKKPADIVLVFDVSGSMKGDPLAQAKTGALSFLDRLHPTDELTIFFFNHEVMPAFGPLAIGDGKDELVKRVNGAIADGGTALYDAIDKAYKVAQADARVRPGRIHALVVMTDGKDEHSKLKLEELRTRFSPEDAQVKVFAIGYGAQADTTVLGQIAEAAQGTSAKGGQDSIVQIYQDMAAFF